MVFLGLFVKAWIYLPNPPGWDTFHHLYLTKYVLDYWPNVNWNHQWAAGMPQFRWYPSAPYLLMAGAVKLFGFSPEFALTLFAFSGLSLMAVGSYCLIREVSGNSSTSLLGALLLLTTPGLWALHINMGLQPRLMSISFLPFSWYFLIKYSKDDENQRKKSICFVATVLSIGLSLLFHVFYGVITLLSTLFLGLAVFEGWKKKISAVAKIGLTSLLLNPFPVLAQIYSPIPRTYLESYQGPTLTLLFRLPSSDTLLSLSPILTLLTILSAIMIPRFRLSLRKGELQFLKSLILMILFTVLFISIGAITRGGPYYLWLPIGPGEALVFLPFCMALICGVMLSRVYTFLKRDWKQVLTPLLCIFILFSFILQASLFVHPLAALGDVLNQWDNESINLHDQLSIPKDEVMYRVGIYVRDSNLRQQFNYFGSTPQTGDYFSQGVLHPNWMMWFHESIWNGSTNYLEKNFLLDWFAVKWFLVHSETSNPETFLGKPQFYESTTNITAAPIYVFENKNATPIVSATSTPLLLVIGKYWDVMTGLSHSNFNSQFVIPIQGGNYVDDYTLEELENFDSIILYDYKYHDPEKAWTLLREFVENGGGLIVETGVQHSSESNSSPLPPILPINRTSWTRGSYEWSFSYGNKSLVEKVNFTSFSPAIYDEYPWGFSMSSNSSVRTWAEPILWNHGSPILVAGRFGRGRVVWSGMNLPWHLQVYRNKEESKFLGNMIDWTSMGLVRERALISYEAFRVSPERIEIKVNDPCKGILLKEFHFKDWHAYLESDGKKVEVEIFKAGPNFMYTPIPREAQYPVNIVFEYSGFLERVGLIISMTTLSLLFINHLLRSQGFTLKLNDNKIEGKTKQEVE